MFARALAAKPHYAYSTGESCDDAGALRIQKVVANEFIRVIRMYGKGNQCQLKVTLTFSLFTRTLSVELNFW